MLIKKKYITNEQKAVYTYIHLHIKQIGFIIKERKQNEKQQQQQNQLDLQ